MCAVAWNCLNVPDTSNNIILYKFLDNGNDCPSLLQKSKKTNVGKPICANQTRKMVPNQNLWALF